MRPQDALHHKVMFADALASPWMERYFDYWMHRDAGAEHSFPDNWDGRDICNDLTMELRMAETYYLAKDIQEVLEHVSATMPPERLHREDLPSTHGWLVFEKPWMLTDVHEAKIPIRAILWSQRDVGKTSALGKQMGGVGQGILLWALSDFADSHIDDSLRANRFPNGDENTNTDMLQMGKDMVARGIRLTPTHVYAVTFNTLSLEMIDKPGMMLMQQDVEPDEMVDEGNGVFRMRIEKVRSERLQIKSGKIEQVVESDDEMVEIRVRPEPLTMLLQALWRFQAQEIAAITHDHLRKPLRRSLIRRQLLPQPVSVIQLRRRAPGPETGVSYTLSHRFVVRGHWRRQWYPSEKRHKSIYISPFIKGPENAPLLSRERVNAIVR